MPLWGKVLGLQHASPGGDARTAAGILGMMWWKVLELRYCESHCVSNDKHSLTIIFHSPLVGAFPQPFTINSNV